MQQTELIVYRFHHGEEYTPGVATLNGVFLGWTQEDAVRKLGPKGEGKIAGKTAIPAGTYKVVATMSNRFKRETAQLLDVPFFEGIRIHGGNTAEDSEGCILIAKNRVNLGTVQGTLESTITSLVKQGRIKTVTIREGWE